MNGLEFLPRTVRVIIYTVYGCAVLVAIGIDAWYGNTDPAWVEAVNRVILAIGAPVMALVAVNVRSGGVPEPEPPETGLEYVPERAMKEPDAGSPDGFSVGH